MIGDHVQLIYDEDQTMTFHPIGSLRKIECLSARDVSHDVDSTRRSPFASDDDDQARELGNQIGQRVGMR